MARKTMFEKVITKALREINKTENYLFSLRARKILKDSDFVDILGLFIELRIKLLELEEKRKAVVTNE